ncbi:hypothetical protein [Catenulispora yoronensis]|uniref:hypothetical protein n=1 Tax=Catenulispora yoronensis TaxID=450799 RepID=UPI0031D63E89
MAAVATVLTGCSSAKSAGPAAAGNVGAAAPASGSAPGSASAGGATPSMALGALPMDAYYFMSEKDTRVVQQAMDLVTRDCMKRFGFDYKPPAPDPGAAEQAKQHSGLGNDDVKQAQLWGYHSPQQPAAQNLPPEPGDGKNSPEHLVLIGEVKTSGGQAVPSGGCKGEAESRVLGPDLPPDQSAVLNGPGGDGKDSTPGGPAGHDPRVQAALKAWKDCMAKAGFSYSVPSDGPMKFLKGPGQSAQPSAPEIAAAVADATCKKQVNLNGIWFQAETDVENKFIEEHATAINELKKSREAEVKRATSIVGAGS